MQSTYSDENSKSKSQKSLHFEKPSTQQTIQILHTQLKRAESSIQSLLHDQESLKHSLSQAVKKKEELFKVLIDYKGAVETLKSKNSALESQLDDVNKVRNEIAKVNSQLTKRDEKIEFLLCRNQELESLISELTKKSETRLKRANSESRHITKNLISNLETMLRKIKANPQFSSVFKTCVPCINSFLELMQMGKLEEALSVMLKFAVELMKDAEKMIVRDLSPALSEIQYSVSSTMFNINSPSCHMEDETLGKEEERIEKLNMELKAVVARSKEVLFNRSSSNSQMKVERFEESGRSSKELRKAVKVMDGRVNEFTQACKGLKNSVGRNPKMEIEVKGGNKSAKIIPKSSILKRYN